MELNQRVHRFIVRRPFYHFPCCPTLKSKRTNGYCKKNIRLFFKHFLFVRSTLVRLLESTIYLCLSQGFLQLAHAQRLDDEKSLIKRELGTELVIFFTKNAFLIKKSFAKNYFFPRISFYPNAADPPVHRRRREKAPVCRRELC